MPAIAGCDDVYARLISGFVLAGVPDATRGGVEPTPDGHLNVENLLQPASAAQGLLLEFPGLPDADTPVYAYAVRLVRDVRGGGYLVEARCPETLFHHTWPTSVPEALAGAIVDALRVHHASFLAWAAQGGRVSYTERLGIPSLPAESPSPTLVRFLNGLYAEGRTLADGPAKGWWAPATVWSGKIEAGLGQDPTYHLGPRTDQLTEEEREHADRLRTAGWAMVVYAGLSGLVLVCGSAYAGWLAYLSGSVPFWNGAGACGGALSIVLWLAAAQALVRQRDRWFFRSGGTTRGLITIAAIFGMVPCAGYCCLGGLPVGAWTLYVLYNEHTKKII